MSDMDEAVLGELTMALITRQAPFHRLQSIYLPLVCEGTTIGDASTLEELRKACRARGVEIVYDEPALVDTESLMSPKLWKAHRRARDWDWARSFEGVDWGGVGNARTRAVRIGSLSRSKSKLPAGQSLLLSALRRGYASALSFTSRTTRSSLLAQAFSIRQRTPLPPVLVSASVALLVNKEPPPHNLFHHKLPHTALPLPTHPNSSAPPLLPPDPTLLPPASFAPLPQTSGSPSKTSRPHRRISSARLIALPASEGRLGTDDRGVRRARMAMGGRGRPELPRVERNRM